MDVTGYLKRLGVSRPAAPTLAVLRELHVAHVERVPYENVDIYLRRPPGIDPAAAAARIIGGRGGLCYHLNGSFALLLRALGFAVTRHRAGVQERGRPAPGADGNHLALTVEGLPAPGNPGGRWMVDVGLGDALHEPVPLRVGAYRQGPFRYRLRRSRRVAGGWRLDHDPSGAFVGVDIAPQPAGPADFAEMSEWLSTAPESPFVRLLAVYRRDGDGVDALIGCVLSRVDAAGRRSETLDSEAAWFGALRERFGLVFADYDATTRAALWQRVRADHEEYERSTAAATTSRP